MGISVGAHGQAVSTGSSVTVTLEGPTRDGSTLVVIFGWDTATFTSITDSGGATWNQIGAEHSPGANFFYRAYYAENITGSQQHTITVSFSAAAFPNICAIEVRCGLATGISDGTPTSQEDVASPFTAPAITTANANDLLVGLIGSGIAALSGNEVFTPANSFVTVVQHVDSNTSGPTSIAILTVAATGTYNPQWTLGGGASAGCYFIALQEDANQNVTLDSGFQYLRHIVKAP